MSDTFRTMLAEQQMALSPYHARKAAWDRLAGLILLVLALPVIGLLVAIVRATSRGPGIYRQERVGKDGRPFNFYKIRSMYIDAEAAGPQWALRKDSRVTPVGRALRFLHLDELPQLYNVARGEMALIGPRPERPVFVERLERDVPHYLDRLLVLPGVTGLAQINLPADETLDCVFKKTLVDREYVANATLWIDIRIFLCTLLRMLGIRHGRAPRWLGLEYKFPAPPAIAAREADEPVVITPAPSEGRKASLLRRKVRPALVAALAHGRDARDFSVDGAGEISLAEVVAAPRRPK